MERNLSIDEVAARSAAGNAVKQIRTWIRRGSLPPGSGFDRHEGRPAWAGILHLSMLEPIVQAGFGALVVSEYQLGGQGLDRLMAEPPEGVPT